LLDKTDIHLSTKAVDNFVHNLGEVRPMPDGVLLADILSKI